MFIGKFICWSSSAFLSILRFKKRSISLIVLIPLVVIISLNYWLHNKLNFFPIETSGGHKVSYSKLTELKAKDHDINFYTNNDDHFSSNHHHYHHSDLNANDKIIYVSLVITARQGSEQFSALLSSISNQEPSYFEVIIVDSSCSNESEKIIDHHFPKNKSKRVIKHIKQCNDESYDIANYKVAEFASMTSRWILFLNDDITLQGSSFIDDMVSLGESKQNAAAVGCKILSNSGVELMEAGRIIWSDASTIGFGHNSIAINAPEFTYPRPIDHVSGTCLLIDKDVLLNYDGIYDEKNELGNYRVADIQMHIQHTLGKEVWFQPRSQAFQVKTLSLNLKEDRNNPERSRKFFEKKWRYHLSKHNPNPHLINTIDKEIAETKASDLNARNPKKANILYFDQELPDKSRGSGFGRAFDNLSIFARLGHKVTMLPYHGDDHHGGPYNWCSKKCRDEIVGLGVELVTTSWEAFVERRHGFYDIVIISRPPIFKLTYENWRVLYMRKPFILIYDCEALWYRRDELYIEMRQNNIRFPSRMKVRDLKNTIEARKQAEHTLISMADFAVPVSEVEKDIILEMNQNVNIETIGIVMNVKKQARPKFHEREGILFLASFNGNIYYNGDAIWYFLQSIYPQVLQKAAEPIPLIIAGRSIPDEIRKFVRRNELEEFVSFRESPHNIESLYSYSRLFIAPHLYGAGLQFKLSEAMSNGIPTIMSKFSADAFRISAESNIACVGGDIESFVECVISLYENEDKWNSIQKGGFEFIRQTHSLEFIQSKWKRLIDQSMKNIIDDRHHFAHLPKTFEECHEGEKLYLKMYPSVNNLLKENKFGSAFEHWVAKGKNEGKIYYNSCNDSRPHGLFKPDIQEFENLNL